MNDKEYIIESDNDCHHYVIPYSKKKDWEMFLRIPGDDERSWDTPEYAIRIDGGDVIFTDWRIGC